FYPGELQCGLLLGASAVSPSPTAWAALPISLGHGSALPRPLWGGHHGAPGDRAGGRLALSITEGVSRGLASCAGGPPAGLGAAGCVRQRTTEERPDGPSATLQSVGEYARAGAECLPGGCCHEALVQRGGWW